MCWVGMCAVTALLEALSGFIWGPTFLIPLLVSSDEWRSIEAGLMQRAELLNLVLRDLYGQRKLILKGVLPPELVSSHPGFLRPCVGIPQPEIHSLLFYAADMARGPDGQVQVMADRTQAPSGADSNRSAGAT